MTSSAKTILITGASRGFGFALAESLANTDTHIIALARTSGGLMELDDAIRKKTGQSATLIPFDLKSEDAAFRSLGENLFNRFGKVDGLVLNAAFMPSLGPIAHIQEKDWTMMWAVNVTANMRLLRVFDPLLRAAGTPQITFISCAARDEAFWGAFGASKKALEQMAISYGHETKQAGFRVSTFDPGPMGTKLRRVAFPGEDQTKLNTPADAAKILAAQLA
jgi:NAD(P)-dependent dehydrogenase (short-subunit alcohol dehydrogenase family)